MKILLIAPASGPWRGVGNQRLFNGRTFRFSLLSLLAVAAETPPGVQVRIVDEQVESVPYDADVDLVGITCMTALAPRAYELASRFRAGGVPVVLGGMHPTLCTREALAHADAVVAGEAEGVWAEVLRDAAAGRLRGVYRRELQSLAGLKTPPRGLLRASDYATVHAVQATRGCPHGCDFCAVSAFSGARQLQRPVTEVAAEVAAIRDRFFIFVDDNLMADRGYADSLFAALAPLRKRWVTQSSLSVAEDPEFVSRAAAAGCIGVFVGLETFSEASLLASRKTFNAVAQYRRAVRTFHRAGIGVETGIVFGFDGDGLDVFRRTLERLEGLHIDALQASVLTPLPGTPLFHRMQGRIVDRNWAHYDFHHVVFRPSSMSRSELQAGHDWVTREFYRPWRITRRLLRQACRPRGLVTVPYSAVLNLAYLGRIRRWGIGGRDPATARAGSHGEDRCPPTAIFPKRNRRAHLPVLQPSPRR